MSNVTALPNSARAHADLLSALFIALRDGVRRGRIHAKACHGLINYAAGSDCRIVRMMLEQVIAATKGDH